MLEKRVEILEKRMDRFEQKLDRVDETLQSLKISLIEISANLRNCATRTEVAELQRDVAYIKGRLENIPSAWQMITYIMGSQVVLAGLLFTALKFGLK